MEERKPTGQQALDLVWRALRNLLGTLGWAVQEVGATIRLFGISPMFGELVLAIVFLLAYCFPGEDIEKMIAFAGTGLAIPFLLGVYYATVNMIWVATQLKRDVLWYFALVKSSVFPATLAWAIFSNRTFQQFIGWGDPASTLRFCIFLVWGVVVANVLIVQVKRPTLRQ